MTNDTERKKIDQVVSPTTTIEPTSKGESLENLENEENRGKESENAERVLSPSDQMFHAAHLRKKLAIAFVKKLFPDKVKFLLLNKLTIEASDFYSETLKKRVADVIYTIPVRNSTNVVKVVLILEHKGQSSPSENKATLAQIFTYVGEFCRREAQKPHEESKASPQPIPVVIYTGSDETLEELNWRNFFALPPCFAEYGIAFPVRFVNMTSLRRKGELPHDPFLETMYEIMTRHEAAELKGFAKVAFRALKRIKRKWTSEEKSLVRELVHFFKEQARSLRVKLEKEDIQALIKSGSLEENMENDAFYEYFAPKAEKAGMEKGMKQGMEKGMKQGREKGREEMKDDILSEQRDAVRAEVQKRFGSVPVPINLAVDKAQSINALVDMRVFALTQASSLDDLVSYAQNGVF